MNKRLTKLVLNALLGIALGTGILCLANFIFFGKITPLLIWELGQREPLLIVVMYVFAFLVMIAVQKE